MNMNMNMNMPCSRNIATQIASIVPDYETQLLIDLIGFIKESYASAPDSVSVTTHCFAVAPLHPLNQHFHVSSTDSMERAGCSPLANHLAGTTCPLRDEVVGERLNSLVGTLCPLRGIAQHSRRSSLVD